LQLPVTGGVLTEFESRVAHTRSSLAAPKVKPFSSASF